MFIRVPEEIDIPPDTILPVVKPLYGIPASGFSWYLTYLAHNTSILGMAKTTVDSCVLFLPS